MKAFLIYYLLTRISQLASLMIIITTLCLTFIHKRKIFKWIILSLVVPGILLLIIYFLNHYNVILYWAFRHSHYIQFIVFIPLVYLIVLFIIYSLGVNPTKIPINLYLLLIIISLFTMNNTYSFYVYCASILMIVMMIYIIIISYFKKILYKFKLIGQTL